MPLAGPARGKFAPVEITSLDGALQLPHVVGVKASAWTATVLGTSGNDTALAGAFDVMAARCASRLRDPGKPCCHGECPGAECVLVTNFCEAIGGSSSPLTSCTGIETWGSRSSDLPAASSTRSTRTT